MNKNPTWIGRNQTSTLTLAERFWEKVDKNPDKNGCWNWIAHTDRKGYGVLRIGEQMVHSNRVAWMVTYGDIPNGLFVCHHCDNRLCCNPEHLFLGNNQDNMRDMARKGRGRNSPSYGESHPNSKVTQRDVEEMRRLYGTGKYTYYQLAPLFGISYQNVGNIITRKTWNYE